MPTQATGPTAQDIPNVYWARVISSPPVGAYWQVQGGAPILLKGLQTLLAPLRPVEIPATDNSPSAAPGILDRIGWLGERPKPVAAKTPGKVVVWRPYPFRLTVVGAVDFEYTQDPYEPWSDSISPINPSAPLNTTTGYARQEWFELLRESKAFGAGGTIAAGGAGTFARGQFQLSANALPGNILFYYMECTPQAQSDVIFQWTADHAVAGGLVGTNLKGGINAAIPQSIHSLRLQTIAPVPAALGVIARKGGGPSNPASLLSPQGFIAELIYGGVQGTDVCFEMVLATANIGASFTFWWAEVPSNYV